MENSEIKEERFSLFDIIILACFISLVFSPVGIALMWIKFKSGVSCKWSKKAKIILSAVFGFLFLLTILLVVFLVAEPHSGAGSGSPFLGMEQEYEGGGGDGSSGSYKPKKSSSRSKGNGSSQSNSQTAEESFVDKVSGSRITYILFFVAIMLGLIVWRNLKSGTSAVSENPYVDTNKYSIPIPEGFVFPQVHYSKITLGEGEQILYATTAEQKANPGDIVVTNKRFLFVSKKDALDLQLGELSSISSVSNTALLLNAGDKTFYFFVQDTQMRFVLSITRWAYEKIYGDAE